MHPKCEEGWKPGTCLATHHRGIRSTQAQPLPVLQSAPPRASSSPPHSAARTRSSPHPPPPDRPQASPGAAPSPAGIAAWSMADTGHAAPHPTAWSGLRAIRVYRVRWTQPSLLTTAIATGIPTSAKSPLSYVSFRYTTISAALEPLKSRIRTQQRPQRRSLIKAAGPSAAKLPQITYYAQCIRTLTSQPTERLCSTSKQ